MKRGRLFIRILSLFTTQTGSALTLRVQLNVRSQTDILAKTSFIITFFTLDTLKMILLILLFYFFVVIKYIIEFDASEETKLLILEILVFYSKIQNLTTKYFKYHHKQM